MDMNIQYGDMNPYKELPSSIMQGANLGLQMARFKKEEQRG